MNDCIIWWGGIEPPDPRGGGGYGYLYRGGRRLRAHRMIYEECFGPIPDGMWVLHHCDNPPCVNPEHLYAGTPKQNSDDMIRRARHKNGWTHCGNGHEWTEENTYWYTHQSGRRQRMCRKCMAKNQRAYQQRQRELK